MEAFEVKNLINHINWCDKWINRYGEEMASNRDNKDIVAKCRNKIKELAKSQDQAATKLEVAGVNWISLMN